jgi:hypothetical protein
MREEIERCRLLFEVAFIRMIHIGSTNADRVKGFKRADKRAGRIYFDLDAAAGRHIYRLRETNCASLQARHPLGPVGHHLQLPESLCDRRRGEAQRRTGGQ